MAAPTYTDLADFLGRPVNEQQGQAVLGVVSAMAGAYTRNLGFDDDGIPNDDIRAVILSASARLVTPSANSQLDVSESHGPSSVRVSGAPIAWSVSERFVLDRYRKKAM